MEENSGKANVLNKTEKPVRRRKKCLIVSHRVNRENKPFQKDDVRS